MEIQVKKLNADVFKKFGQIVQLPPAQQPTMAGDCFAYFKQQAVFNIEGQTEIGILKIKKHNMNFSQMEKHIQTPEILVSLDGAFILPVAPPSEDAPMPEQIEAFKVPQNHAVVMDPSCWHWLPNPADKDEITIMVIFKDNTSQDDLVIQDLSEECRIVS